MESALLNALATQVPDLVILLIIVLLFLRHMNTREATYTAYLQKRDQIYIDTVTKIGDELTVLTESFKEHAIETTLAVAEMRRVSGRKKSHA